MSTGARKEHSPGTANPTPGQIHHAGLLVLTTKGYVAQRDEKSLKQRHKQAEEKVPEKSREMKVSPKVAG